MAMWFSFWRSRDRFSLEELRYLTDHLLKVQIVNEVNKDFVVEALRSLAELVTYGDQHDPTFFEFFMEKQIMGEFTRILRVNTTRNVPLQLLQTISIMIQNLRSEHAIYYIFSNEHINYIITHNFDFKNEELLSYYISFLRAISGKLNRNTIPLLVKTKNDEIISFPLYIKAIEFAFHEENMVRIAVRALTLNVYHVGDEHVNKYVSSTPLSNYFSDLTTKFRDRCIKLDSLVSEAAMNQDSSYSTSCILAEVDGIEDNLYYFSDVISAGVPDLGRLITDNMLQLLVFPLLLPSLDKRSKDAGILTVTSLYLLCCILRILKTKELASSIATALFFQVETFNSISEARPNGHISDVFFTHECQEQNPDFFVTQASKEGLGATVQNSTSSSQIDLSNASCLQRNHCGSNISLREVLLSYITIGNNVQILGSLGLLATLLQTKELDESMLDGLGILPQRKQHKKLLLQALVGEGWGEEKLFSPENSLTKDCMNNEFDRYMEKLKDKYGLVFCCRESGISSQINRCKMLDALVSLFCRSNVSSEALWAGGWLLRQLLPHSEEEFNSHHLKLLKDAHMYSATELFEEIKGTWCDLLIQVLADEWRKCKKAIEASSPQRDPKCILLSNQTCSSEGESSFVAAERMFEKVKVFVLRHQLLVFSCGGTLPDQPSVHSPMHLPIHSRAKNAGLDVLVPKPGTELNIVDAVCCRIAFERGRERNFCFLAICNGTSGWVLLAEELPLKQNRGVVRVAAPLAGSNPRIDDKHLKWLHLRIRPSSLPTVDPSKTVAFGKGKTKVLVDGRWTLAFQNEQACKSAESMIHEEMHLQCSGVEKRLRPLVDIDSPLHAATDSFSLATATDSL